MLCILSRSEETPLQYMNQPNGNRLPPEEIPSTHGHPENEQSHRIRLRGVSLLLFFFLATWVAAAISVAFRGMQVGHWETFFDRFVTGFN